MRRSIVVATFRSPFILAAVLFGMGIQAQAVGSAQCQQQGGPNPCTNPAHLYQKIYEVMVSTSANCTGMIQVFKTANPPVLDWTTNPVVGQGVIPNGTYNCIAARTDDIQTYVPAANELPGCTAGTTYTWDIFTPSTAPGGSTPPNGGTNFPAQGDNSNPPTSQHEDDPWSYMSTTGKTSNTSYTPDSPFLLSTPWVVGGDITHQIVLDFDGTIGSSTQYGTNCAPLDPPQFIIR
jgi:hypothetical protein